MSKLVGGSPSVHASGPCLSTRETEWGEGPVMMNRVMSHHMVARLSELHYLRFSYYKLMNC